MPVSYVRIKMLREGRSNSEYIPFPRFRRNTKIRLERQLGVKSVCVLLLQRTRAQFPHQKSCNRPITEYLKSHGSWNKTDCEKLVFLKVLRQGDPSSDLWEPNGNCFLFVVVKNY